MKWLESPDTYGSAAKKTYLDGPRGDARPTAPGRMCRQGSSLVAPAVFSIPASLVVTAEAYREFMRKNRLDEMVEALLGRPKFKHINAGTIEELQQPAQQIQEVIRASPLPEHIYHLVLEGCQELGCGSVVVWPVAMPVGLSQWSREYQQFPYLEASGATGISEAIHAWWASLFDSTSIFLRELKGQRHRDARITLAVQAMPVAGPEVLPHALLQLSD